MLYLEISDLTTEIKSVEDIPKKLNVKNDKSVTISNEEYELLYISLENLDGEVYSIMEDYDFSSYTKDNICELYLESLLDTNSVDDVLDEDEQELFREVAEAIVDAISDELVSEAEKCVVYTEDEVMADYYDSLVDEYRESRMLKSA